MTLDPDVAALVRKLMRARKLTFKQAINTAIRAGMNQGEAPRFETPTYPMGFDASIPYTKALRLAGELEDDELARKLSVRK